MWWEKDQFTVNEAVPDWMYEAAGPVGPALVRAWPDGTTDKGWAADMFMENYRRRKFDPARMLPSYELGRLAIAVVMRSLRVVCIDIDGKNGGLVGARALGNLPYTAAETSKSGNGYHLYYLTSEDVWDDESGFAMFRDRISLVQGVDLKALGCVYHYKNQRWNGRAPVELPEHLKELLMKQRQQVDAKVATIQKTLVQGDVEEVLLMHEELLSELGKPIPSGRRNNTLFAIGSQMLVAGVPGWEDAVRERAGQVGLDSDEIDKLVANVSKYGAKTMATP